MSAALETMRSLFEKWKNLPVHVWAVPSFVGVAVVSITVSKHIQAKVLMPKRRFLCDRKIESFLETFEVDVNKEYQRMIEEATQTVEEKKKKKEQWYKLVKKKQEKHKLKGAEEGEGDGMALGAEQKLDLKKYCLEYVAFDMMGAAQSLRHRMLLTLQKTIIVRLNRVNDKEVFQFNSDLISEMKEIVKEAPKIFIPSFIGDTQFTQQLANAKQVFIALRKEYRSNAVGFAIRKFLGKSEFKGRGFKKTKRNHKAFWTAFFVFGAVSIASGVLSPWRAFFSRMQYGYATFNFDASYSRLLLTLAGVVIEPIQSTCKIILTRTLTGEILEEAVSYLAAMDQRAMDTFGAKKVKKTASQLMTKASVMAGSIINFWDSLTKIGVALATVVKSIQQKEFPLYAIGYLEMLLREKQLIDNVVLKICGTSDSGVFRRMNEDLDEATIPVSSTYLGLEILQLAALKNNKASKEKTSTPNAIFTIGSDTWESGVLQEIGTASAQLPVAKQLYELYDVRMNAATKSGCEVAKNKNFFLRRCMHDKIKDLASHRKAKSARSQLDPEESHLLKHCVLLPDTDLESVFDYNTFHTLRCMGIEVIQVMKCLEEKQRTKDAEVTKNLTNRFSSAYEGVLPNLGYELPQFFSAVAAKIYLGVTGSSLTMHDCAAKKDYYSSAASEARRIFDQFDDLTQGASFLYDVIHKTPVTIDDLALQKDPSLRRTFHWKFDKSLELHDVSFSYPTTPYTATLNKLTMTIQKGEMVAIIGPTGCGKSTILKLLQRLFDTCTPKIEYHHQGEGHEGGQITVDGTPVENISTTVMRQHIATVPQHPTLIPGSVFENIAFGMPNVTEAEVEEACKQAQCHDFISKMAQKYHTQIAPSRLSGGEQQRIALARALVRKPDILLLDEATSALDAQTEKAVQASIDALVKSNTTVIVVAHRLSTIVNADRICVIQHGQCTQEGPAKVLAEDKEGWYAQCLKGQSLAQVSRLPNKKVGRPTIQLAAEIYAALQTKANPTPPANKGDGSAPPPLSGAAKKEAENAKVLLAVLEECFVDVKAESATATPETKKEPLLSMLVKLNSAGSGSEMMTRMESGTGGSGSSTKATPTPKKAGKKENEKKEESSSSDDSDSSDDDDDDDEAK